MDPLRPDARDRGMDRAGDRWTKGKRFEYDPWWTDNVFSIAGIFNGREGKGRGGGT